ncbi:hypothetical protein DL767_001015 [Monosporascus sp. MG133]|nr:hypothetical protein DL767_001015 [Monosporascus sp. MG133]
MAPERLQRSYSKRYEDDDERNPQKGRGLRNDTTTPPALKTLARFPITADQAPPLTLKTTSTKRASSAPPISCAVSAYRYSPLPEGYIRLLRLIPHRDEHAPVQCQLFDYPLLDSGKGTHLYETLSYVWGSSEKPQSISTDEGYIPVTINLYMALKRLRDYSLDRIIWVDAVCINQDNIEERNHQVQFMVKIYAKASRVIVWLEEATAPSGQVYGETVTDSDRAFEELRIAADGQPTKSKDDETTKQAILTLLQRSWFQRIWVLQEVAAARHVLIMCRSAEIDGYTFCLGELVDMYHSREATDRRDKVYALLGMSSDDHIPAGLSPDYGILWKDLFHRLVKFLIGEQASVETWEGKEIAVIKTKGCILGKVSSVENGGDWNDRPRVGVISKNTPGYLGQNEEWRGRWTLHASAKSILDGDVVCLLQGASKPTIIRLFEDYCAVIAIAADMDWPNPLRSVTTFPRDFLLVWDWEKPWGRLEDGEEYECFINSRVPQHAKTESDNDLDRATRVLKTGLIFTDSEKYEEADKILGKAIEALGRISSKEHPQTLAAVDNLVSMYRDQDHWNLASKLRAMTDIIWRRGVYSQVTESVMINVARCFDREVMALLLDRREDEVEITEGVAREAYHNRRHGPGVMKLLLDRKGGEIKITERVLMAAAAVSEKGEMKLLLDRKGDEIEITEGVLTVAVMCYKRGVWELLLDRKGVEITEGVLKEAAETPWRDDLMEVLLDRSGDGVRFTPKAVERIVMSGYEWMSLLLDRRGDEIEITEGVLKAAARAGPRMMRLLLYRKWKEIEITEGVLKEAAKNCENGVGVMNVLLDQRGGEIKITEGVLMAAANNPNVMELLLDRRGDEIKITKRVLKRANSYSQEGRSVRGLLLYRMSTRFKLQKWLRQRLGMFGKERK